MIRQPEERGTVVWNETAKTGKAQTIIAYKEKLFYLLIYFALYSKNNGLSVQQFNQEDSMIKYVFYNGYSEI